MVRRRVVGIEVVGEAGPGEGGFLTLLKFRYRNRYEDGSASRPYLYEYIHRKGFDSVAIALYYETPEGPFMAYRLGIRVPVHFRKDFSLPLPDHRDYLLIPEAVAGSLEPGDRGAQGLLARVVAEAFEEAGFRVRPRDVEPLGGGFFPSHGQSSEKIHLCAVRVDPSRAEAPPGDGSVNEADAPPVFFRPVREILRACAGGEIEDPKIELLAQRLCLKRGFFPVQGRYALPEEAPDLLEFQRSLQDGGWGGPPDAVDSGTRV